MNRIITLAFIGMLWSGAVDAASSQEAPATPQHLTLAEAQKIALENHPLIKAGDFRADAAEEDVAIARSGYLPQVSGNAVRVFADDGTRIAAGNGITNPTIVDRGSAGVGVSQLLTDFGRTGALLDASKLSYEAQKDRTLLTRQGVQLEVTRSYYNLLRAEAMVRVARTALQSRQSQLDRIDALHQERIKSDLDTSIARQVVDESQLLLLRSEGNRDSAKAALSEALGYRDQREFILADETQTKPPPENIDDVVEAAMSQHPELAALKAERDAAQRQADAEAKANYPTVSAMAYAGETPFRNDSQIDSGYAAAGINISIPFYTGGRLSANERKAEARAKALSLDVTSRENQLTREIRNAFDQVRVAYRNIEVSDRLLKNARESLELTQARYDIGSSSIVDLNQSQLSQIQAEIGSASARYDYLIALAMLKFRSGQ